MKVFVARAMGALGRDSLRASVWLPAAADVLGAKPPRRLGWIAAGEAATVMMTEVRGAANKKAKRELGWSLRHPSWRQGFARGPG